MTVDNLVSALQARAWYPVAGIALFLLLDLLKRGWDWTEKVPVGYRWLVPLGIAGTTAFVDGFVSQKTWQASLGMAGYAVLSMGLASMGVQGAAKESPLTGGGQWGGKGGGPLPPEKDESPKNGVALSSLAHGARRAWLLVAAIAIGVAAPACAAVASALPIITATVQDAAVILDSIEDFSRHYFAVKPDPEKEKKVFAAVTKCRAALNATLRATKGTEELTQKQYEQAFADFTAAYNELLALVGPLGVRPAGSLAAARGGESLEVPTAESFLRQVK